jgi:hypothetical protein
MPLDAADLLPALWRKLCLHWHILNDVQSARSATGIDLFNEQILFEIAGNVKSSLFVHFPDCAVRLFLVFGYFASRKSPFGVGLEAFD